MLALDYCRQKAAESHSSFLSGFRFLSVEKRNAITVLYAFCRELDDVVDGCTDPNVAQITLIGGSVIWRKCLIMRCLSILFIKL